MTAFIQFKPDVNTYKAFITLEAINGKTNPEILIKKAIFIYSKNIKNLRKIYIKMQEDRKQKKPIYAQDMWEIGNIVYRLKKELELLSLEIDGMYDHLTRDLGAKKKWLEKAIIFRRYIKDKNKILKPLRWGKFEKSTKKKALMFH